MNLQQFFARKLPGVPFRSIEAVIALSKDGATVPFIARYRKEKTGGLDEVQVRDAIEGHETFDTIVKRKAFVSEEIEKQGQLTNDLKVRIEATWELGDLEELYRPFKKKKKTKATIARDGGLQPLADWIWAIGHGELTDEMGPETKAKGFLNQAAGFVTWDGCLKGAMDILVERATNKPDLRAIVRKEMMESGKVVSRKGKEPKGHSKFETYFEFEEPVKNLMQSKASHRYLAMRRGWEENELTVVLQVDETKILPAFRDFMCNKAGTQVTEFLQSCADIAYRIHVLPSITNEVHRLLKEEADKHAVRVFSENVRKVLLSSPFGAKWVLGVDPGVRTGCKLALVDNSGHFITHTVLNILDAGAEDRAKEMLKDLVSRLEAVAVGNGTGGREAQTFFRKVITDLAAKTPVIMVNESGASVYSASDVAREEFPELDLTVRGAISIARRLQDPLAELVKIDPKSIGVGQYQHDVSQTDLKKSLDFVVESCVNHVGVNLNTASEYLLRYVSGIGPAVAKNVVQFRKDNGLFQDRDTLLKVPSFSSKTFEQAAGFLRVPESQNPLDNTGVHPERYQAVREMAKKTGVTLSQLMGSEAIAKLRAEQTEWKELVGEFTFDDIVNELEKPGRDPRDPFKAFSYRDDIHELKDLKAGMICPGIVTNVTNFGAFVDIGVHQDGLVHISELSNQFVSDPTKMISPGDVVTVKVLGVNLDKNQISLSMKTNEKSQAASAEARAPKAPRAPRQERPPRPPRETRAQAERKVLAKQAQEAPISDAVKIKPMTEQDKANAVAAAAREKNNPRRDNQSGPRHDRGGGGRRDERGASSGPKKPAQPLNNPFGALAGLKESLRK